MGKQLFTNNARSELSGALSIAGTTLYLATATGSRFPSPAAGDYFLGTIYEKDASGNELRIEVVKVTARNADSLTIVRDFESMTGNAGGYGYPSVGGATVYFDLRWTAFAAGNTLQGSANLSDMPNVTAARLNLGLGSAAQAATGDFATAASVAAKQNTLISGSNIKTVNTQSLVGGGNITVGEVTLAGVETLTNKRISTFYALDKTVINNNAAGNIPLDLTAASIFVLTMTGNITLQPPVLPALADETLSFLIRLKQGATAYLPTWFSGISWITPGGAAPAAPAANKTVEYILSYTGAGGYVGRKGAAT
jgi:hypothetical protein